MTRRAGLPVLLALVLLLLIGSIDLTYTRSTGELAPNASETRYGKKSPDSDPGESETNATADVPGTLLSSTTDVLYLNNTNTTSPYFVRFSGWDPEGVTNLDDLVIGIDNGTARSEQIVVSLGKIVQLKGNHVRLEPGSVNLVYVTRQVSTLGLVSEVPMDVIVADDPDESAFTKLKLKVKIV